jgi:hypothetical protein
VFTAFDILEFHTHLTYNDFGNMPYYELMELLETFKPRLKEIAEAKQASQMAGVFGGK